jgi:signal transduction histidine kinase
MTAAQMAQRLARLEAVQAVVLDINRRSARRQDLPSFFKAVHEAIASLMDARNFYIALYEEPADAMRFVYRVDEKENIPDPATLFPLPPPEESPTAWIIRRGEPLIVTIEQIAARNTPGQRWGSGPPAEHWVGMPLIGNDGRTFGAIVIQSYIPGFRYTDEDIALFGLMSEHVAEAIEHVQSKARLEQAIAERTRSLETEITERRRAEKLQRALYEISALSVKDIDLDRFYTELHRIVGELMYAKNFIVMLYDKANDVVRYPYYADEYEEKLPPDFRRPAGDGLSGYVLRTRQPQLIDLDRFNALVASGQIRNVIGDVDFNVWMGAPMHYQNRVLGSIIVQSYDLSIGYTDEDLKLLTFVADHIGAALARKQADDALRLAHSNLAAGADALRAKNRELETTLTHLGMAQSELVRQEKLASLGALVAGIAHEVNTPLGICVTAVSHLAEEMRQVRKAMAEGVLTEPGLQAFFESTDEVLRILTTNTERASGLIRSFKQVAVDQSSDDIREIALAEYIEETLKSLRPKLKRTRHAIEVECDPELRVHSVPGALSQILTNLVINSIVHGFEHIEEGRIRIAAHRKDANLILDFSDNGVGMSAEALKHLFDPFYTTKRGRGGSGLGANIVYNLVTSKLGGTISVDSAAGKGLHYRICVPVQPPPPPVAAKPPSPAAARVR